MPTFALVTPYLPAPDNTGGRIRINRLARALAAYGPIDLFACMHQLELSAVSGDPAPALSIYRQSYLRSPDLGSTLPLLNSERVRASCPWRLKRDLTRAHTLHPYAAVISCHSYSFATARALRGSALVLDEHNIESCYSLAVYPGARRESELLARWERMAWAACDMVSVVTDADARHIEARCNHRPCVCPNGADFADIGYKPPSRRAGYEILFVGAMSHPPNVEAARELVKVVLPEVKRSYPQATVTLCGRSPSPEVLGLASASVTVTGTVTDVRPLLARASVYVNLVRAGAGSCLKVPEALCAGLPMVSTAIGVRGFALRDGEHLSVAERPADIVRAVLSVWRDPAALDARAERARELSRALDWAALGERWAEAVMSTVEARRRRG